MFKLLLADYNSFSGLVSYILIQKEWNCYRILYKYSQRNFNNKIVLFLKFETNILKLLKGFQGKVRGGIARTVILERYIFTEYLLIEIIPVADIITKKLYPF